jgi:asparagine synthase (glutamine-hydrolysing)
MPVIAVAAQRGATLAPELRRQLTGLAVFDTDSARLAELAPAGTPPGRTAPRPRTILPGTAGSGLVLDGYILDAAGLSAIVGEDPRQGLAATLHAGLLTFGPAFLSHLNGDFALVWHDGRDGACLLASDIMGQRSLYYAVAGGCLYAASQPSLLLGFRDVPDTPDAEALAYRLYDLQHLAPERTPYRHIRLLPPGHALMWRDGTTRIQPFWSPVPRRTIRFRRDSDYVDAARDLLDRAVAGRVPEHSDFLCQLSAGLDSSAVATSAAQLDNRPFHTITVRPDPTAIAAHDPTRHFTDEWQRVQPLLARYPQITGHGVDAQLPGLDEEEMGGLFWSRDWPAGSLHRTGWLYPPIWDLARQLDTRVILSGSVGNASFSHDGRWVLADAIRRGRMIQALAWLTGPERRRDGLLRALWNNGVRPLLPYADRLGRRGRAGLAANSWTDFVSVRRDVADRLGLSAQSGAPPARTGSRDLDRHIAAIEATRIRHATHSALKQRGAFEIRDPTADRALIDFCLAIPRDQYHRHGIDRYLARRMLADRIPPAIADEPRIAPGQPDWFAWADQRRAWIDAELARIEQSPLACELLDVARMRQIFDDWPASAEEAARPPRVHLMRHALGHGLRVGQMLARIEGRNE